MGGESGLAAAGEAARLFDSFLARGAVRFDTEILQPAASLLDLYGEDIRSRAYVTEDAVHGELMLRPDFTVPLAKFHMEQSSANARYAYSGPVFRRQWPGSERAREYLQVGYEVFGAADGADSDAEVYCAIDDSLAPHGLLSATGDLSLLIAAVDGLDTSQDRRDSLKRHIWRPARFRRLLESYCHSTGSARDSAADAAELEARIRRAGPVIGLRGVDEIAERVHAKDRDALTRPLIPSELSAIEELLAVKGSAVEALPALRAVGRRLKGVDAAVDRLEARLDALSQRGIKAGQLWFEASYGRTSLEYYDGFVFGFYRPGQQDLVALGGRYDQLVAAVGEGRTCPAVGGVVRPELTANLPRGGT